MNSKKSLVPSKQKVNAKRTLGTLPKTFKAFMALALVALLAIPVGLGVPASIYADEGLAINYSIPVEYSDTSDTGGDFSALAGAPVKNLTLSVFNITADAQGRSTCKPYDMLRYIIEVSNTATEPSTWENVELTVPLSEYLYDWGAPITAQIDGVPAGTAAKMGADYLDRSTLFVDLGDIESGEMRTVTFEVQIHPLAAGAKIDHVVSAGSVGWHSIDYVDAVNPARTFTIEHYNVTAQQESYASGQPQRTNVQIGDTIRYYLRAVNHIPVISDWYLGAITVDLALGGTNYLDYSNTLQYLTASRTDMVMTGPEQTGATIAGGLLTVPSPNLSWGGPYSYGGDNFTNIGFEVVIAPQAAGQFIQLEGVVAADGTRAQDVGFTVDPFGEVGPEPMINKSVINLTAQSQGRTTNKVGDKLQYTILLANGALGPSAWRGVVLSDPLSEQVNIDQTLSSVKIDGVAAGSAANFGVRAPFTPGGYDDSRTLYVELGNIGNLNPKTVTFEVTIGALAAGASIQNVASAGSVSHSVSSTVETPPPPVKVAPVKDLTLFSTNITAPGAGRTYNKVGDVIRYQAVAANKATSLSTWEQVIISDTFFEGLDLSRVLSSLKVNGAAPAAGTASFGSGAAARTLSVNVGNINNGEQVVVTFDVVIASSAAGLSFTNTVLARGAGESSYLTSAGVYLGVDGNPPSSTTTTPTTPTQQGPTVIIRNSGTGTAPTVVVTTTTVIEDPPKTVTTDKKSTPTDKKATVTTTISDQDTPLAGTAGDEADSPLLNWLPLVSFVMFLAIAVTVVLYQMSRRNKKD
jgi:fimbrial isopeptide formation D2 family protein/uncharacterized repeat protein (TIGR01451 family)